MRRLIAYLTLALSLILGVALNIATPLKNLSTNFEYRAGQEFVYRISDKDEDVEDLAVGAIDEVADLMDKRMQNFGVSEYNIAKEGNNIVRTTTSLSSNDQYERLQAYLNYNANFSIRIAAEDETEAILNADEVFKDIKARVEYRGPYPVIVIPLSNPEAFKTNIVDVAERIQTDKEQPNEEGGQPDLVTEATIVLWTDFDPDTDSFIDRDQVSGEKVLLTFDYRTMWWNDDKTEIGVASPIEGEQGKYTTQQIKKSSETARFMVNIFNAGEMNYKVDFLFANKVSVPTVEPLIVLGEKDRLALSATLFATVFSFIITMIVVFAIYRMPIVTALSSGLLTFLGTILSFLAFQVEFSTSAVIGLIIVSMFAVIATIIYAAKFRNEVYKGRTFKKAHNEAITKSTFINLDLIMIMLVSGVFTYFFGGAALSGLASTLIFGSIVSLVSVLIHNAVLLWLLANNTSTQKNYKVYGIDGTKVPNLLNDEKQTYFGRFVNHEVSKKSKVFNGVFGAISLSAIVIISVFAGIGQNPFNLTQYDSNITRVYFQVSERSEINSNATTTSPEALLDHITLDGEPLKLQMINQYDAVLETNVSVPVYESKEYKTFETDGEAKVEVTYQFYVYNLIGRFDGSETVEYTLPNQVATATTLPLFDALNAIAQHVDGEANVSINQVYKVSNTPHYGRVSLVTLVVLALTSLYIAFRYGLSRGLTNLVGSIAASSGVLLFFIATRISVTPLVTIGALVAVITVALINIIINNQVKELTEDQAFRNYTRREHLELGLRHSLSPIYAIILVYALTFLVFTALGPMPVSAVFVASLIAVLLSLLVVTKLHTALNAALINQIAKLGKIKWPQSKKKQEKEKLKVGTRRSSEPEEAVFIGIND